MDSYRLANLVLQWDGGGFELAPGRFLEFFRCDAMMSGDRIQFQGKFVSLEYYTRYPIITENSAYALFDINGEHMLIYHWGNRRFAFAIWPGRIDRQKIIECWFDPDMISQPKLNADWFFGVSGLHKALLLHGAAVLHASYINWNSQAVLFTAPSGTGKSTQAALWEKYAGAEIVNGDRVLVRQCDGRWYAFGYPCCGSSKICLNRTLPLCAIVVLQQGDENRIEQLTAAKKIRALTAATEMYPWDVSEIDRVFCMAEVLVQDVPVLRLVCRPDADAVYTLLNYLEEKYYATGI